MFQRITEQAIEAVIYAQHESRRLGHNRMGTELLLVGLIQQDKGIAAKALSSMGIRLEDVRREVEEIVGTGDDYIAGEISFNPQGKHLVNLSQEESRQLGCDCVDTEHFLLALLRYNDESTRKIFEKLGVDLKELHTQLMQELRIKESSEAVGVIEPFPISFQLYNTNFQNVLTQLQMAIKEDCYLNIEDKTEALEQVMVLAEERQNKNNMNETHQKSVKTALKILKGTIADLPPQSQLVSKFQYLLPAIAESFNVT
jgi:ATP-dependent Clp protease ATP-binding subunit ClpA